MHLQLAAKPLRCRAVNMAGVCILLAVRFLIAHGAAEGVSPGTVTGVVADTNGSVVGGAIVTLQPSGSTSQRTTITDQTGAFHFPRLDPGTYVLTIAALGFEDRQADVSVVPGENPPLPRWCYKWRR
jgi:hypothetical protein